MATYSLQRERAKSFLRSERFPVPTWDEFFIQGPFIINPDGYAVQKNVIADLEYFLYLQRLVGFSSDWIPAPSKNPYRIGHFDERIESMVEKLHHQVLREGSNS